MYILTKVILIVSFKEVDNCICNDKASHLRRLCKAFTAIEVIEQDVWSKCLATANAVKHRNKDCASQYIKLTMISVYKIDTIVCLKHIAAEEGVSLSYRSRSEEARRTSVKNKSKEPETKVNRIFLHSLAHAIMQHILLVPLHIQIQFWAKEIT